MSSSIRTLALAALVLAATPAAVRASESAAPDTDPTSTAALGDGSESMPCALVTRAEASRAVGAPVPVGTERNAEMSLHGGVAVRAQYCLYGADVVVGRFPLGSSGRSTFARYRKSAAGTAGYRGVAGVGDEAFSARGQLNVRRGNTGIIIDVGQRRRGALNELSTEKALATTAIARL